MRTRTSRFFVDQDLRVDLDLSLPRQTSHHIKNVLRLAEGDFITLFNGRGGEYRAIITGIARDRVSLHILTHEGIDRESPLTTELGLSIIKRDAMDLAIVKSTELGVTRIVPLLTQFTTVARKQADKRFPHWLEIIRSACEQCGRNKLPELGAITSLSDWIENVQAYLKLVADPTAIMSPDSIEARPDSVVILTGPEGGLSETELEQARRKKFRPVSLGPRVLRANTAPLVMLTMIQQKWGDL